MASDAPTSTPTSTRWNIHYINGTAAIADDHSKLSIQFQVSPKDITQADLNVRILKESCNTTEVVPGDGEDIFSTSEPDFFVNDGGNVTLTIGLNETFDPTTSGFWVNNETTNVMGLGFCIRTDLTDSQDVYLDGFALAMQEATFWLGYDLDAGFSTLVDEVIDGEEIAADDVYKSFQLEACICENDACVTSSLELNQDFELCVWSPDERMLIESVTSMTMTQEPDNIFKPVVGGRPNVVSFVKVNKQFDIGGTMLNGAVIGSKAVPLFFDDFVNGELPNIVMSGTTTLGFDKSYTSERRLEQKERSAADIMAEDGAEEFTVSVPLSTAAASNQVEMKDEPIEEDQSMLYIVALLSFLALIALAVVLRRKKRK